MSSAARCLPLAAAWAVWLGFFAATGLAGFSLREDGYLLTLAERVLRGDVPYRDFSYIRPPLSILIQAALSGMIPGYGIAAERWYFAVEVGVVLTIVAVLLRRVEPAPLPRALAALAACLVAFTAGFAPKPWHTLDGILFSVLAAWALVTALERRALGLAVAAGLAAGAAALCKQGFALVLAVGLVLTLTPAGRRAGPRPWSFAAGYAAGGAALAAATFGYLLWHGALPAAFESVVLAPREITREVFQRDAWSLLVGMHLPSLTGFLVGLAVVALVAPRVPWPVRLAMAILVLVWAGVVQAAWRSTEALYHVFVLEAVYSAVWIGAAAVLLGYAIGRARLAPGAAWAIGLALATLYASTWSYVALRSSGLGLALALPLVLLALAGATPGAASPRRWIALSLLTVAALAAASGHVAMRHSPAAALASYATDGLRGIRSRAARARGVDAAVALLARETAAGDPVFAFMDFPALYFLTGRVNPTRVDWFLPEEVTAREVARAVADLTARPPRLVVLFAASPRRLQDPRLAPVLAHITARYEERATFGELRVLTARGAPGAR